MSAMDLQHCHWCGSEFRPSRSEQAAPELKETTKLCPECHEDYEAEAHRPLHPMEERHPHHN